MLTPPLLPLDFDVVIVGSGLSGLVAAHTIKKKSPAVRFCVLEAETHVGGQISTHNNYDLGCGRWFSPDEYHMRYLCDTLEMVYTTVDNQPVPLSLPLDTQAVWEKYEASKETWQVDKRRLASWELGRFLRYIDVECREYAPESLSVDDLSSESMESFLCRSLVFNSSRNIIRLLVLVACGLEARNVTFVDYMIVCYGTYGITNQLNIMTCAEDQLLIRPNFGELIKTLTRSIGASAIYTDTRVTEVNHLENHVSLLCANSRRVVCETLIVAIPLQAIHGIRFEPELPKKYMPFETQQQPTLVTIFACDFSTQLGIDPVTPSPMLWYNRQLVICPSSFLKNTIYGMHFTKSPMPETDHSPSLKDLTLDVCIPKDRDSGDSLRDSAKWFEKSWKPNVVIGLPTNKKWKRVIWAGTNAGTLYRGFNNGAVQGGTRAALQALRLLRPVDGGWVDITDVLMPTGVQRRSVGYVQRKLMSLNLLNGFFIATVVCPFFGYGAYYVWNEWRDLLDPFKIIFVFSTVYNVFFAV